MRLRLPASLAGTALILAPAPGATNALGALAASPTTAGGDVIVLGLSLTTGAIEIVVTCAAAAGV